MTDQCPNCGELLVQANIGHGEIDVYCENCHWPDDVLDAPLACVVCGGDSVGVCGDTMRCEDHWID